MSRPLKTTESLYETDFYAWTQDQAARLRARSTDGSDGDIDWPNLIEEIETLGRAEKREAGRLVGNVLLELMKWRVLVGSQCGSLRCRIQVERLELRRQLTENASLQRLLPGMVEEEYEYARLRFVADTGLAQATNPAVCPFTIDEILDPTFYPEAA